MGGDSARPRGHNIKECKMENSYDLPELRLVSEDDSPPAARFPWWRFGTAVVMFLGFSDIGGPRVGLVLTVMTFVILALARKVPVYFFRVGFPWRAAAILVLLLGASDMLGLRLGIAVSAIILALLTIFGKGPFKFT
jgi:hypothetical protein